MNTLAAIPAGRSLARRFLEKAASSREMAAQMPADTPMTIKSEYTAHSPSPSMKSREPNCEAGVESVFRQVTLFRQPLPNDLADCLGARGDHVFLAPDGLDSVEDISGQAQVDRFRVGGRPAFCWFFGARY